VNNTAATGMVLWLELMVARCAEVAKWDIESVAGWLSIIGRRECIEAFRGVLFCVGIDVALLLVLVLMVLMVLMLLCSWCWC